MIIKHGEPKCHFRSGKESKSVREVALGASVCSQPGINLSWTSHVVFLCISSYIDHENDCVCDKVDLQVFDSQDLFRKW